MADKLPPMCGECGGKCCQYFCFQIDVPDTFEEFDDLRWYLLHDGITIHVDDGDWYISIANRCKALGDDGRCAVYEDRPVICRRYSMANCDFTAGDYGYDELFQTPEDIEKYARKLLGKKAYKKARQKAYAKAERQEKKRKKKRWCAIARAGRRQANARGRAAGTGKSQTPREEEG